MTIYLGTDCDSCGGTKAFNLPCPWCEIQVLRARIAELEQSVRFWETGYNKLSNQRDERIAELEARDAGWDYDLVRTENARLREALEEIRNHTDDFASERIARRALEVK